MLFHHIHSLYLVDVRHFQNYIVVHFFTLFWRSLWPSAPDSRPVCLNVAPVSGTDQAMLF